jgi:hypothetical protein
VACCRLTEPAANFYSIARKVMTDANMDLRFQLLDA